MRILITSSHIVNGVNIPTLPEGHQEVKEGRHMPWNPQMAKQFPFCIVFCHSSWKSWRVQDDHWCKHTSALSGIARTMTDRYLHWMCKWEVCFGWVTGVQGGVSGTRKRCLGQTVLTISSSYTHHSPQAPEATSDTPAWHGSRSQRGRRRGDGSRQQ